MGIVVGLVVREVGLVRIERVRVVVVEVGCTVVVVIIAAAAVVVVGVVVIITITITIIRGRASGRIHPIYNIYESGRRGIV